MSRFVKLTPLKAGAPPVFVNVDNIVCIGELPDSGVVTFVNAPDGEKVRERPAEILALLDAAPENEVTDEAAHAALCVYHDEPADDIVWSDVRIYEMRAAINAALRVMRGQR